MVKVTSQVFRQLVEQNPSYSDKELKDIGRLSEFTNLDRSRVGHDNEKINRDVTTIDQGLRKTAGDFIKTGYTNENFNVTSNTGGYKIKVDGKEQYVQGQWYYGHDKNTGKDVLIGGSFKNGMDGNVLMFKQGADGAMHYAQVQGKYDSKGNLVAGNASDITRTQFVEAVKDNKGNVKAQVVADRQGANGGPSVAVNAQGGKHVDMTNTFTTGTNVSNVQTLAGSASQNQFEEQGGQLHAGDAAVAISIGERAVEVTADKISQVSTVAKTLHDPVGRKAKEKIELSRTQDRLQQNAERKVEQVKRDGMAKTTRTLQNQSKGSNLPKSGGPAPRPTTRAPRPTPRATRSTPTTPSNTLRPK